MIARTTTVSKSSQSNKPAYRSPRLVEVGKTATLLQGPMVNAPYFDAYTYGKSNWPTR